MYTNFRYKNDKFKKQFYILKIFDKHKKNIIHSWTGL